jgi:DNA-binding NtrC family response regulator
MDTEAKILVVDDEENLLRSVAKTLFREGFEVETAEGNAAAYAMVQAARIEGQPFDLVILDLNMPNFEGKESKYAGLELLERLKKLSPEMPVIVNSAWDEVETAKTCIDKGAADYFVKGRTDEMLQKIRTVLDLTPTNLL